MASANFNGRRRSWYEGIHNVNTSTGVHPMLRGSQLTMPNFLLIGAAKAGTSAAYAYLRQHPEVFGSETKEPGFFALEGQVARFAGPGDRKFNRGCVTTLASYQALFSKVAGQRAVGEASTMYLYSPKAPARIRHYLPAIKLLAILRNPVDRAYSGYRYLVRDGLERLPSFEDALEAEDARVAANWQHLWYHKRLGFYYVQLQRYFDLFPRDQIAVYLYEEFQANPLALVQQMFAFLGADPSFAPDVSLKYNVSGEPKSRLLHAALARPNAAKNLVKGLLPATMRRRMRAKLMARNIQPTAPRLAPETRRYLMSLYRDDILRLQSLIDRDLSPWLAA
jgi:sulfotransferase family protein